MRASDVDGFDGHWQEDEAGLESEEDDCLNFGDAGEAPFPDFTLSLLLLSLLSSFCLSRIHATGGRRSSALSRDFKDTTVDGTTSMRVLLRHSSVIDWFNRVPGRTLELPVYPPPSL